MDLEIISDLGTHHKKSFKEKYKKLKIIGGGTYGVAILIVHRRTGRRCIAKEVKLLEMNPKDRIYAKNEVITLSKLSHPNIVKYLDSFENQSEGLLYTVMEYAEGGDLWNILMNMKERGSELPQSTIVVWFQQQCSAIKYLHDRTILHRDLKSRNVFVSARGNIKVGDFGLSTNIQYSTQLLSHICGTPHYFSPEICQKHPYNYKADIWSLGCILYEMCTMKHAFTGKDMNGLTEAILKGEYDPIPHHFDSSISKLISSLLQVDPTLRISLEDVLQMSLFKTLKEKSANHSIDALGIQPRHKLTEIKDYAFEDELHDSEDKWDELIAVDTSLGGDDMSISTLSPNSGNASFLTNLTSSSTISSPTLSSSNCWRSPLRTNQRLQSFSQTDTNRNSYETEKFQYPKPEAEVNRTVRSLPNKCNTISKQRNSTSQCDTISSLNKSKDHPLPSLDHYEISRGIRYKELTPTKYRSREGHRSLSPKSRNFQHFDDVHLRSRLPIVSVHCRMESILESKTFNENCESHRPQR